MSLLKGFTKKVIVLHKFFDLFYGLVFRHAMDILAKFTGVIENFLFSKAEVQATFAQNFIDKGCDVSFTGFAELLNSHTYFGMTVLSDMCCVDYLIYTAKNVKDVVEDVPSVTTSTLDITKNKVSFYRFHIFYHFLSIRYNSRLKFLAKLKDISTMPSISKVFKGAVWMEREIWDLFGVVFSNNKDLRRILTDYGFEGFPMRKDFPLTGFKELSYSITQPGLKDYMVSLTQEFRSFFYNYRWKTLVTKEADFNANTLGLNWNFIYNLSVFSKGLGGLRNNFYLVMFSRSSKTANFYRRKFKARFNKTYSHKSFADREVIYAALMSNFRKKLIRRWKALDWTKSVKAKRFNKWLNFYLLFLKGNFILRSPKRLFFLGSLRIVRKNKKKLDKKEILRSNAKGILAKSKSKQMLSHKIRSKVINRNREVSFKKWYYVKILNSMLVSYKMKNEKSLSFVESLVNVKDYGKIIKDYFKERVYFSLNSYKSQKVQMNVYNFNKMVISYYLPENSKLSVLKYVLERYTFQNEKVVFDKGNNIGIGLPVRRKSVTVLRSPHVNKRSKETFVSYGISKFLNVIYDVYSFNKVLRNIVHLRKSLVNFVSLMCYRKKVVVWRYLSRDLPIKKALSVKEKGMLHSILCIIAWNTYVIENKVTALINNCSCDMSKGLAEYELMLLFRFRLNELAYMQEPWLLEIFSQEIYNVGTPLIVTNRGSFVTNDEVNESSLDADVDIGKCKPFSSFTKASELPDSLLDYLCMCTTFQGYNYKFIENKLVYTRWHHGFPVRPYELIARRPSSDISMGFFSNKPLSFPRGGSLCGFGDKNIVRKTIENSGILHNLGENECLGLTYRGEWATPVLNIAKKITLEEVKELFSRAFIMDIRTFPCTSLKLLKVKSPSELNIVDYITTDYELCLKNLWLFSNKGLFFISFILFIFLFTNIFLWNLSKKADNPKSRFYKNKALLVYKSERCSKICFNTGTFIGLGLNSNLKHAIEKLTFGVTNKDLMAQAHAIKMEYILWMQDSLTTDSWQDAIVPESFNSFEEYKKEWLRLWEARKYYEMKSSSIVAKRFTEHFDDYVKWEGVLIEIEGRMIEVLSTISSDCSREFTYLTDKQRELIQIHLDQAFDLNYLDITKQKVAGINSSPTNVKCFEPLVEKNSLESYVEFFPETEINDKVVVGTGKDLDSGCKIELTDSNWEVLRKFNLGETVITKRVFDPQLDILMSYFRYKEYLIKYYYEHNCFPWESEFFLDEVFLNSYEADVATLNGQRMRFSFETYPKMFFLDGQRNVMAWYEIHGGYDLNDLAYILPKLASQVPCTEERWFECYFYQHSHYKGILDSYARVDYENYMFFLDSFNSIERKQPEPGSLRKFLDNFYKLTEYSKLENYSESIKTYSNYLISLPRNVSDGITNKITGLISNPKVFVSYYADSNWFYYKSIQKFFSNKLFNTRKRVQIVEEFKEWSAIRRNAGEGHVDSRAFESPEFGNHQIEDWSSKLYNQYTLLFDKLLFKIFLNKKVYVSEPSDFADLWWWLYNRTENRNTSLEAIEDFLEDSISGNLHKSYCVEPFNTTAMKMFESTYGMNYFRHPKHSNIFYNNVISSKEYVPVPGVNNDNNDPIIALFKWKNEKSLHLKSIISPEEYLSLVRSELSHIRERESLSFTASKFYDIYDSYELFCRSVQWHESYLKLMIKSELPLVNWSLIEELNPEGWLAGSTTRSLLGGGAWEKDLLWVNYEGAQLTFKNFIKSHLIHWDSLFTDFILWYGLDFGFLWWSTLVFYFIDYLFYKELSGRRINSYVAKGAKVYFRFKHKLNDFIYDKYGFTFFMSYTTGLLLWHFGFFYPSSKFREFYHTVCYQLDRYAIEVDEMNKLSTKEVQARYLNYKNGFLTEARINFNDDKAPLLDNSSWGSLVNLQMALRRHLYFAKISWHVIPETIEKFFKEFYYFLTDFRYFYRVIYRMTLNTEAIGFFRIFYYILTFPYRVFYFIRRIIFDITYGAVWSMEFVYINFPKLCSKIMETIASGIYWASYLISYLIDYIPKYIWRVILKIVSIFKDYCNSVLLNSVEHSNERFIYLLVSIKNLGLFSWDYLKTQWLEELVHYRKNKIYDAWFEKAIIGKDHNWRQVRHFNKAWWYVRVRHNFRHYRVPDNFWGRNIKPYETVVWGEVKTAETRVTRGYLWLSSLYDFPKWGAFEVQKNALLYVRYNFLTWFDSSYEACKSYYSFCNNIDLDTFVKVVMSKGYYSCQEYILKGIIWRTFLEKLILLKWRFYDFFIMGLYTNFKNTVYWQYIRVDYYLYNKIESAAWIPVISLYLHLENLYSSLTKFKHDIKNAWEVSYQKVYFGWERWPLWKVLSPIRPFKIPKYFWYELVDDRNKLVLRKGFLIKYIDYLYLKPIFSVRYYKLRWENFSFLDLDSVKAVRLVYKFFYLQFYYFIIQNKLWFSKGFAILVYSIDEKINYYQNMDSFDFNLGFFEFLTKVFLKLYSFLLKVVKGWLYSFSAWNNQDYYPGLSIKIMQYDFKHVRNILDFQEESNYYKRLYNKAIDSRSPIVYRPIEKDPSLPLVKLDFYEKRLLDNYNSLNKVLLDLEKYPLTKSEEVLESAGLLDRASRNLTIIESKLKKDSHFAHSMILDTRKVINNVERVVYSTERLKKNLDYNNIFVWKDTLLFIPKLQLFDTLHKYWLQIAHALYAYGFLIDKPIKRIPSFDVLYDVSNFICFYVPRYIKYIIVMLYRANGDIYIRLYLKVESILEPIALYVQFWFLYFNVWLNGALDGLPNIIKEYGLFSKTVLNWFKDWFIFNFVRSWYLTVLDQKLTYNVAASKTWELHNYFYSAAFKDLFDTTYFEELEKKRFLTRYESWMWNNRCRAIDCWSRFKSYDSQLPAENVIINRIDKNYEELSLINPNKYPMTLYRVIRMYFNDLVDSSFYSWFNKYTSNYNNFINVFDKFVLRSHEETLLWHSLTGGSLEQASSDIVENWNSIFEAIFDSNSMFCKEYYYYVDLFRFLYPEKYEKFINIVLFIFKSSKTDKDFINNVSYAFNELYKLNKSSAYEFYMLLLLPKFIVEGVSFSSINLMLSLPLKTSDYSIWIRVKFLEHSFIELCNFVLNLPLNLLKYLFSGILTIYDGFFKVISFEREYIFTLSAILHTFIWNIFFISFNGVKGLYLFFRNDPYTSEYFVDFYYKVYYYYITILNYSSLIYKVLYIDVFQGFVLKNYFWPLLQGKVEVPKLSSIFYEPFLYRYNFDIRKEHISVKAILENIIDTLAYYYFTVCSTKLLVDKSDRFVLPTFKPFLESNQNKTFSEIFWGEFKPDSLSFIDDFIEFFVWVVDLFIFYTAYTLDFIFYLVYNLLYNHIFVYWEISFTTVINNYHQNVVNYTHHNVSKYYEFLKPSLNNDSFYKFIWSLLRIFIYKFVDSYVYFCIWFYNVVSITFYDLWYNCIHDYLLSYIWNTGIPYSIECYNKASTKWHEDISPVVHQYLKPVKRSCRYHYKEYVYYPIMDFIYSRLLLTAYYIIYTIAFPWVYRDTLYFEARLLRMPKEDYVRLVFKAHLNKLWFYIKDFTNIIDYLLLFYHKVYFDIVLTVKNFFWRGIEAIFVVFYKYIILTLKFADISWYFLSNILNFIYITCMAFTVELIIFLRDIIFYVIFLRFNFYIVLDQINVEIRNVKFLYYKVESLYNYIFNFFNSLYLSDLPVVKNLYLRFYIFFDWFWYNFISTSFKWYEYIFLFKVYVYFLEPVLEWIAYNFKAIPNEYFTIFFRGDFNRNLPLFVGHRRDYVGVENAETIYHIFKKKNAGVDADPIHQVGLYKVYHYLTAYLDLVRKTRNPPLFQMRALHKQMWEKYLDAIGTLVENKFLDMETLNEFFICTKILYTIELNLLQLTTYTHDFNDYDFSSLRGLKAILETKFTSDQLCDLENEEFFMKYGELLGITDYKEYDFSKFLNNLNFDEYKSLNKGSKVNYYTMQALLQINEYVSNVDNFQKPVGSDLREVFNEGLELKVFNQTTFHEPARKRLNELEVIGNGETLAELALRLERENSWAAPITWTFDDGDVQEKNLNDLFEMKEDQVVDYDVLDNVEGVRDVTISGIEFAIEMGKAFESYDFASFNQKVYNYYWTFFGKEFAYILYHFPGQFFSLNTGNVLHLNEEVDFISRYIRDAKGSTLFSPASLVNKFKSGDILTYIENLQDMINYNLTYKYYREWTEKEYTYGRMLGHQFHRNTVLNNVKLFPSQRELPMEDLVGYSDLFWKLGYEEDGILYSSLYNSYWNREVYGLDMEFWSEWEERSETFGIAWGIKTPFRWIPKLYDWFEVTSPRFRWDRWPFFRTNKFEMNFNFNGHPVSQIELLYKNLRQDFLGWNFFNDCGGLMVWEEPLYENIYRWPTLDLSFYESFVGSLTEPRMLFFEYITDKKSKWSSWKKLRPDSSTNVYQSLQDYRHTIIDLATYASIVDFNSVLSYRMGNRPRSFLYYIYYDEMDIAANSLNNYSFTLYDRPEHNQIGFQDPASPIMEGIIDLHHDLSFFLILISIFVFWILCNIIYHYATTNFPFRNSLRNRFVYEGQYLLYTAMSYLTKLYSYIYLNKLATQKSKATVDFYKFILNLIFDVLFFCNVSVIKLSKRLISITPTTFESYFNVFEDDNFIESMSNISAVRSTVDKNKNNPKPYLLLKGVFGGDERYSYSVVLPKNDLNKVDSNPDWHYYSKMEYFWIFTINKIFLDLKDLKSQYLHNLSAQLEGMSGKAFDDYISMLGEHLTFNVKYDDIQYISMDADSKMLPIENVFFPKLFTHNTQIEIIWTIIPAIILVFIAIPSFSLLYAMDQVWQPMVTVKVIGNQWYWSYEYC